jgi:fatty-acyl-CoA synthase
MNMKLTELSLGTAIRSAASAAPGKVALVDYPKGKRYTYPQLNERANALANGLSELGVKKGDFVAILLRNGVELIDLSWAAAKIGAILAPLPYRLEAPELKQLLNYCEAETIILANEFQAKIDPIKKETKLKRFITPDADLPAGFLSYDALMKSSTKEPDVEIKEDLPYVLLFSSGTTGLPKGFLRTQYQWLTHAYGWYTVHDFTSSDIDLIVFPLFGGVALTNAMAVTIARASMIVMDFEPNNVLKAIDEEKPTFINLVPTMAQILLQMPVVTREKMSSLRAVSFVGSALPQAVLNGVWQKITPNVYEYYGLQDCGTVTAISPEMKRKKPTSCGAPIPILDMRVVDANGQDVPKGETGEVIVSAPSSAASYYKEPKRTSDTFKGRWMYTGDLGKLDEDRYLYIVGRTKDMIITGGQNVSALDVEEVLFTHDKIRDCAVIGLPDEKWGEIVTAVIIPKPESAVGESEIIDYCKAKMAAFKVPKKVVITDAIPRTATGKVQKFILVKKFSGQ